MKLNVGAFAVAFAVWWGVGFFLVTWWIIATGGATGEPTFVARVYFGYEISPLGSVIGFAWAFVDALISGAIFAWLYNWLTSRISFGAQDRPQSAT